MRWANMFYRVKVNDKIRVEPSMLNMDIKKAALHIIRDEYERRVIKELGFVLLIDEVEIQGEGVVLPGDPYIYYNVTFSAVIFELNVNEVVKGPVKDIVDFGAFVSLGPVEALLHTSQIGSTKYVFDKKNKALVPQTGKGGVVKKGDVVIAKVSTVSWKHTIQDTRISLTMKRPGLTNLSWKKA
jgi:DNA-directed RNA polymerase subunit E'